MTATFTLITAEEIGARIPRTEREWSARMAQARAEWDRDGGYTDARGLCAFSRGATCDNGARPLAPVLYGGRVLAACPAHVRMLRARFMDGTTAD